MKVFKKLATVIIFMSFYISNAQVQNPWQSTNTSENPWGNSSEESKGKKKNQKGIEIKEAIESENPESAPNVEHKIENPVEIINQELVQETPSATNVDSIITPSVSSALIATTYINNTNIGRGAFIGSMLSSSLLNIFMLPINLAGSQIMTEKDFQEIDDFKNQYPEASEKEIQSKKKNVKKRKVLKALGGTALGCLINIGLIMLMAL